MKIEVGKRYIDGVGVGVDIVSYDERTRLFNGSTADGSYSYGVTGEWMNCPDFPHYNLVKEATSPFISMVEQLTNQDRWVLFDGKDTE